MGRTLMSSLLKKKSIGVREVRNRKGKGSLHTEPYIRLTIWALWEQKGDGMLWSHLTTTDGTKREEEKHDIAFRFYGIFPSDQQTRKKRC